MTPLRAVLFDAGNTLLFLDYARLAERVGSTLGLPLTSEGLSRHVPAATRAMEQTGGADRARAMVYLETLFSLGGVSAARMPELHTCLARMHQEQHLWSGVTEGSGAALRRLREAGLKLGVVSNSDGRVDEALEAAGLRQYFDVVVDSALVGVEKPNPGIFHAALEVLGVKPEEALYVGDLYEVDVLGARAAGLQAILLGTPPNGTECPSASSIEALVNQVLGDDA